MTPVAVTGFGVLSPNGTTADAFWTSLMDGVDRRGAWQKRPLDLYPVNNVISIPEDTWQQVAEIGDARTSAMAAFLVDGARTSAALPADPDFRVGCILASTTAGAESVEHAMQPRLSNRLEPRIDSGLVPRNGFRWSGPTAALSTACSSGLVAPAMAAEILDAGEANAMIAGGLDVLLEYTICGFNSLRLATGETCRPFSADRKGVVLSEGGACFSLEPLAQARARAAPIRAVILGYGLNCDAGHPTAPSAAGISRAIQDALTMSKVAPDLIGGIVTHGTGTPTNDSVEIEALRLVFGASPLPPLMSLKAAIGHSQAGAGASALLAAILSLKNGIMPGTARLDGADPLLGSIDATAQPRPLGQRCLMINAFGFGGNNCVFIVGDEAFASRVQ